MKTIECQRCHISFEVSMRANNVKYCPACRIIIRKQQTIESGKRYIERQRKKPVDKRGNLKLQCPICGEYYQKLAVHTYQKHGITASKLKKEYGLDQCTSLMNETAKRRTDEGYFRGLNKNPNTLLDNLLVKGRETRYKKEQEKGKKKNWSAQSMARLHKEKFQNPFLPK